MSYRPDNSAPPGETRSSSLDRVLAASALALALLAWAPASIAAADGPGHPLDPLSLAEQVAAVRALRASEEWGETSRLALLTLDEPDKEGVLAWKTGDSWRRRAFAIVVSGGRTFEAVIDLAGERLASWTPVEGVQPGILLTEEWRTAQEIVRAHPGWREAIRRRGIAEPEDVVPVPLTAGYFGRPLEATDRLLKVLSFDGRETSNYWGRPIEGLVAVVSLSQGKVVELIDGGEAPIPDGPVDLDPGAAGEPRAPLNAVTLDQPGGPSYQVDGHFVRWSGWSFHWRLDPRLGMVLSLVRFGAGESARSILYQASLSEMFVPYTDPGEGWYFRAYMDAGEYGLGKLASRLEPGVDCPAHATFLASWFVDEWGNPWLHERSACLFERYAGDVAWRHFESVTGRTDAARLTELVVRTVPAVGNYDYVLDWVFRPDGSIRAAVGATGVPQVKAVASRRPPAATAAESAAGDGRYGHWVAEHTVAIHHDHFFNFRLDLDVDGRQNGFVRERLRTVEVDGPGPRTSTWIVDAEAPATEGQAKLTIDLQRPALWRVVNPRVRGPLGYPVSYQLVPERNAVALFSPTDFVQRRAGFTGHHLWVTPYRAAERYAAGVYPNQSRGGDGLPSWTSRDRPIQDTDIVLWYTLGMRHVVRTEDWPVMPTVRTGFELRPFDFFARNPALDLPR